MVRILLAILLVSLSGCGGGQPTLAGGKWARALRDPDARLRQKAAFTLGNIGSTDPAVVPALTGALKDRDAGVRCQAVLALVKCGPVAREAIPVLAEVEKNDRDAKVRVY